MSSGAAEPGVFSFLPHDASIKRDSAVMWCLSVRLSVTFVDSVKTNKHIFKIFSPSGGQAIVVFLYQLHGNIPTGTP